MYIKIYLYMVYVYIWFLVFVVCLFLDFNDFFFVGFLSFFDCYSLLLVFYLFVKDINFYIKFGGKNILI